jgi:signal transduction histidine kinase
LSVGGRPIEYSPEVELQLLRIAQEAVRNATRHGAATHIHIVIDYGADRVLLSVSDNGRGFVVGDYDKAAAMGEHLGLLGMRERAERIEARLTVTSTPGQGTTIEVSVPMTSGNQA